MARLCSIFRNDLFSGKVAIVTGGGSGIGRGITEELVSLGCTVVIAARKSERLQKAAKDINHKVGSGSEVTSSNSKPALVHPYECNIRKEEQVFSGHISVLLRQN